jgi:flagellar basal-body rod modification protein FlgD
MMQTTLNNAASNSATSNTAGSIMAGVDTSQLSDMFTKLLVAQIQNQDPTQPSDPSQYVTQLSQLSQVEALQQMASQSGATNTALQSLQMLALGGQVGNDLTVNTNTVTLSGQAVNGSVALSSATSQATVLLTGADGSQHAIALGPQGPGLVNFTIDPAQLGLTAGTYALAVRTDTGVSQGAQITGTLQSVRVGSSGSAVLSIRGVGSVDPAAITQYNGRSAA